MQSKILGLLWYVPVSSAIMQSKILGLLWYVPVLILYYKVTK